MFMCSNFSILSNLTMEENEVQSTSENAFEEIIPSGYNCVECGKIYSTFSNLSAHIRKKHCSTDVKIDHRKSLICPICNDELISKRAYEKHLLSEHDVKLDKLKIQFDSVQKFSEWKETIERKNNCMYVKRTGTKKNNFAKIDYLYCHRSGEYKASGTGKRSLKSKGSNKIQKFCPSTMKLTLTEDLVNVEYVKTHLGHSFDIERMKINEREKNAIVQKLEAGMTVDQVIESIERPSSGKMEPIHMLTRRDILNIGRDLKIPVTKQQVIKKGVKKANNEAQSDVFENNCEEINLNICSSDQNNSNEGLIYIESEIEFIKAEVIDDSPESHFEENLYQKGTCEYIIPHNNNKEELDKLFRSIME